MMDVTRNPPCSPKCPGRMIGCHVDCEKYLYWKKALEAEALRCEKVANPLGLQVASRLPTAKSKILARHLAAKEAAQNVNGLARERKEWLRQGCKPIWFASRKATADGQIKNLSAAPCKGYNIKGGQR